MNVTGNHSYRSGIGTMLQNLMLVFIVALPAVQVFAQDTVYPFGQRTPFEITEPQPANFPFQYPEFIGDINGDGFGDLVINRGSGNEQTPDPMDAILKSAIITDIANPDSCQVLYGTNLQGIKDYNGDGFDDVLDISNMVIYFGSQSGISDDTLQLDYPNTPTYNTLLYYAGDISNDGRSELFIAERNTSDTVYIYSGPTDSAIVWHVPYDLFDEDNSMFGYYDFDKDGENEFLACSYVFYNYKYQAIWYRFNTLQNKMILDKGVNLDVIYEPTSSYPSCLADPNGDGRPDITHTYYYDYKQYGIEVCFGQDAFPYFSEPVQIPAGNPHRIFYVAGDVNNDGADDWYSITAPDSITVYYGNENIAVDGFIKENYYTGNQKMMYPLSKYYEYYLSENIPVFYYDPDSIPDILLNYWTIDENLRFDTIGCAIIRGGEDLDFTNPLVLGRKAADSYTELQYGFRTKSLGDMNNDGIDDWGTLALKGCYAEMFFGDTYFHTEPDVRILLPQVSRTECYDWSSGDLNGDGWGDLAISNSSDMDIYFVAPVITRLNRVFIFFGGPDWPVVLNYSNADMVLEDTAYFYEFGKNIGIVGDYNADGFSDLAIGGTRWSSTFHEVYLYFGGDTISSLPDMVITQPANNGYYFGDPITPCGDINADGYPDFTLGDPNKERSLVYFGGPNADDKYDVALTNPQGTRMYFGDFTVRKAGDFDGDGYNDIVQSSYHPTEGIYIYKGGPAFDSIYEYAVVDTSINYQGPDIEFATDFTAKGKSDLYVNNYRTDMSFIYSEPETADENADYILKGNLGMTHGVASGDFDCDGHTELCTGNANERDYGYLYGGVIQFYRSPVYVGVKEAKNKTSGELIIYPNPARDQVMVSLPGWETGIMTIEISDLTGKSLSVESFDPCGVQTINLDIRGLSPGIYILKASAANSSYSQKLVVLR
jgi:hypothetical protein